MEWFAASASYRQLAQGVVEKIPGILGGGAAAMFKLNQFGTSEWQFVSAAWIGEADARSSVDSSCPVDRVRRKSPMPHRIDAAIPEPTRRIYRHVSETPDYTVLLALDLAGIPLDERANRLLEEILRLLKAAAKRFEQLTSALELARASAVGSPVCGWIEVDRSSWRPLRVEGPAEGWLAALRGLDEPVHRLPKCLREKVTHTDRSHLLSCPGVPAPGLQVLRFHCDRSGRILIALRQIDNTGPQAPVDLTRREREVLSLMGTGQSRCEVASQLGVSKRTVDKHLEHAYGKLHATGLHEALARLARQQLDTAGEWGDRGLGSQNVCS